MMLAVSDAAYAKATIFGLTYGGVNNQLNLAKTR